MKKYFTLVELMVIGFIGMVLLSFIIMAGLIIGGGCWLGNKVSEEGLKPTVERVYEGPATDEQAPSNEKE